MRKYITIATIAAAFLLTVSPAQAEWEAGVKAFQAGNYSQAVTEFREVTESQPSFAGGWQMLGQSLLKLGRAQEAASALREAYDQQPNDIGTKLALAQAYLKANRRGDAKGLLDTIDESGLSAANKQAYTNLKLAASGGRASLADLRQMAAANPQDATIQYKFGVAALNAGEGSTAVSALEKAVRLDPSTKKHRALAKAYILSARQSSGSSKIASYRNAVDAAQKVTSDSASYDNLLLLGEAQLGAKQYDGAIRTFERAHNARSSDWLAVYYKGQAQSIRGQYETAERTLKQALNLTSSSQNQARIWRQLGFVYEKQKEYDQAKSAYNRGGDQQSVRRVAENQRIAEENEQIEAHNEQVEEIRKLKEEQQKLEEEMGDLPPDPLF